MDGSHSAAADYLGEATTHSWTCYPSQPSNQYGSPYQLLEPTHESGQGWQCPPGQQESVWFVQDPIEEEDVDWAEYGQAPQEDHLAVACLEKEVGGALRGFGGKAGGKSLANHGKTKKGAGLQLEGTSSEKEGDSKSSVEMLENNNDLA
uniref:Uncharacterized protein n=1 Tax=Sphaerodactylus townsendi TaxID=933632 RepID=A0ACB8ECP4_9SAUR